MQKAPEPKMEIRKIKANVLIEINDEERATKARELAQKLTAKTNIEGEKKRAVASYSGSIKVLERDIQDLAVVIESGKEMRYVELEEELDFKRGRAKRFLIDPERVYYDERIISDAERQMRLDTQKREEKKQEEKEQEEFGSLE